jgi:hypothetical protein
MIITSFSFVEPLASYLNNLCFVLAIIGFGLILLTAIIWSVILLRKRLTAKKQSPSDLRKNARHHEYQTDNPKISTEENDTNLI